ncbi:pyridoxamine 5'-phosphate oxidase [Devosia sp. XJ19-1]|uniref:Pyridoxine/pyridoxamine 5'-phosphate oxidase n=1 Tax=Devosia ureilytica TaxID=2952754 RepID=A0A9Q4AQP2_9HYPH|nr:pyridoxamine 5'-phosphate oxidase [Devosia ureilytica]MCP8884846.1 pyridoxamine 5'-phosphate oxidase [Devosia ureilytica]MCP8888643.1 pyridoxamine 5'-phosphate oxidase [Devosia ureilytica]
MNMLQTLTERLFNDSDRSDLDPYAVFEEWFALAEDSEPNDPHAMALATVDENGVPDVRMVLLNRRDARGICFFTNFESDKGRQLVANPQAAMVMHWKSLRRQVRMRGPVERVTEAEADEYFASRAKGSRIASATSKQSRPLTNRQQMMDEVAALTAMVGDGDMPRPTHWSGFRLMPTSIEFWKDGEFRLHDRVRFTRDTQASGWTSERLYP